MESLIPKYLHRGYETRDLVADDGCHERYGMYADSPLRGLGFL